MADHSLRPALWMLCGALAFAAMGAFTHAVGTHCDWRAIALVRVLFMLASAVGLARFAGVPLAVFRPPTLWLRSLAGSFSLVCNFYAMTRLPIADVLTLTNTYPLWIVLLSAPLLRQVPTPAEWLGVASGLAGVVLVQQPHLGGDDRLAAGVALVSSLSTSLAMIGLHRLRGVDPRAVVAHFAGVGSLVAGASLLARPGALSPALLEPITLALLLAVGVSGTVGQFFLTRAFAAGPPAAVSAISLTQVVFGMIFDAAFWGRTITPLSLAGFALILGPTAWLTGRAARRLATARTRVGHGTVQGVENPHG